MKTKTMLITLLFSIAQISFAQKEKILTYEKFDELSKTISDLQMKNTGIKVDNGTADVVFNENNFKVFYNDKLASYSYNFTVYGHNYLVLIENIDFSKAIGLYENQGVLYVVFPENHLTTQIYGDNENQNSTNKNVIEFYTNSEADREIMFKAVYDLIVLMKYDKGILMTLSDGYRDLDKYKTLNPYEFFQQYPQSVLAYEGLLIEQENLKKEYEKQQADAAILKKNQEYVLALAKKYNYYPRMTIEQFGAISSSNEALAKKAKKNKENEFSVVGKYKSNEPVAIRVTNGFITFLNFTIEKNGWSDSVAIDEFNKLANYIQSNLASQYYTLDKSTNDDKESKWAKLVIKVPGIKLDLIEINLIYSNSLMNELKIIFYEKNS